MMSSYLPNTCHNSLTNSIQSDQVITAPLRLCKENAVAGLFVDRRHVAAVWNVHCICTLCGPTGLDCPCAVEHPSPTQPLKITHTDTHIPLSTPTHTYILTHTFVDTPTHSYIHTHTCIHTNVYIYYIYIYNTHAERGGERG